MCGIAGQWRVAAPAEPTAVHAMCDALRHRGPDAGGVWSSPDGHVVLGHRRLAVIDLSPGGAQPMVDGAGGLVVVFNGEIFNFISLREELEGCGHVFRTRSDTEVILAAYRQWGEDCLDRLNGQFAFAIYDTQRRRIFLARDRVGEKPLYYRHTPEGLWFASEIKALLTDPSVTRRIDREALDHYLAYGHVPSPLSMFEGIRKLPAAHAMTFDVSGDLRIRRYWSLPGPFGAEVDPGDLVAALEVRLETAVRRQLVSDVPIGVLLSGGVDSSLVAAMACRVSATPVRTYTVSFPDHPASDEAPYARAVAEHLGTVHTELRAEPSSVDVLETVARQFDEPLGDHALLPTALVAQMIRSEATVALGGDGGDELFGGYPHLAWLQRSEQIRRTVPQVARSVAAGLARYLPAGTRGRNHLVGLGGDCGSSAAHVNLFFDRYQRLQLVKPAMRPAARTIGLPELHRAGLSTLPCGTRSYAAQLDFYGTLSDGYLVKVDRASMLHSLEVRSPFLDRDLVEFAFGKVPDHLRPTSATLKYLPKTLARRLLPAGFNVDRKQGFTMPLGEWFAGRWGDRLTEIVTDLPADWLDRAAVGRVLAGQRAGRANTSRVFALAMLSLWRRFYDVQG